MPRPSSAVARWVRFSSIAVAVLFGAVVVSRASHSAYSAVTANSANSWTTGTISLTDDDAGTAMFASLTGLKPGSTGTHCIAVTSSGNLPSAVRLYGTGAATTLALSTSINLVITQGTAANFASCTGFTPTGTGSNVYTGTLAAFAAASTNYASGVGTWAPTGAAPETRVFQFQYTINAAAPTGTAGGTASIGFTWEVQNT